MLYQITIYCQWSLKEFIFFAWFTLSVYRVCTDMASHSFKWIAAPAFNAGTFSCIIFKKQRQGIHMVLLHHAISQWFPSPAAAVFRCLEVPLGMTGGSAHF